jgi:hypothetical protein
MSKIIIGTAHGKSVGFELDALLPSRLLVTADSGGGKSWVIRVLCEQLFGKVQVIMIDPEGEFASLREKFAYVLVGKDGETPADPRSAALVAQRLLELRASAVCDLYDVKANLRHEWVKLFLTALIEAPKNLRNACVVIVDEAHIYCPEKGAGESEASGAMIDLCTRGRKRGLCAVFATQRLASLRKDASSQLQNRLIGPTFEDVNRKRAAEMLGIVEKDKANFYKQIQLLESGNFFAFGRAITKELLLVHIRAIQTTHPKAFEKHTAPPPPMPDRIKALLPKLADLPKEAEDKARTEAEYKREIRELKTKVAASEKAALNANAHAAHSLGAKPTAPDPQQARAAERTIQQLQASANRVAKIVRQFRDLRIEINAAAFSESLTASLAQLLNKPLAGFQRLQKEADAALSQLGFQTPTGEAIVPSTILPSHKSAASSPEIPAASHAVAVARLIPPLPAARKMREPRAPIVEGEVRLGELHVQIAGILAGYYPEAIKSSILASLCGKTMGGSWSGRLSEVRSAGLLEDTAQGWVRATEKCASEYLGRFTAPSTTEEVLAVWNPKWGQVGRDMMKFLVEQGGEAVTKAQLAEAVGLTMGGSFSGRLSEVRSSGLLSEPGKGRVAANKEALFLEAA